MCFCHPEHTRLAAVAAGLHVILAAGYLSLLWYKTAVKEDRALVLRCLRICWRWALKAGLAQGAVPPGAPPHLLSKLLEHEAHHRVGAWELWAKPKGPFREPRSA